MKNKSWEFTLGAIVSAALILEAYWFVNSYRAAAFNGPTQPAGTGSGIIAAGTSNNLGLGSLSATSTTKLLIAASSTSASEFALKIVWPNGSPILAVRNDGRVGILAAAPGYALDIAGAIQLEPTSTPASANGAIYYDSGLNKFRCYENSAWTNCIGSGGGGTLTGSGTANTLPLWTGSTSLGNSNITQQSNGSIMVGANFIVNGNSTFNGNETVNGNLTVTGNITGTVVATLNAGNVSAGTFGAQTGGGNYVFPAALNVSGTLTVGGGTGKINTGTIDPIYTIGGRRYATYLPGMTGVKEETSGVVRCQMSDVECQKTIDFNNVERGSDLWLFSRVTNLKNNFDKLAVLLTPSFDGHVWYEKDAKNLLLKIFATATASCQLPDTSCEISYRLTAPRFDAGSWPNYSIDKESGGFVISDE